MATACNVEVRYLPPPPRLRRFFGGIFLLEIEVGDGEVIEDFMFPDWAAIRFNDRAAIAGNSRDGEPIVRTLYSVSGPRSQEVYLRTGSLRQWGALVHPLGWTLLFGKPASEYANRLTDGMIDPAFARFRPLADELFGPVADPDGELQRFIRFFEAIDPLKDPAAPEIAGIYAALIDPACDAVSTLAERAGVSRRTLERLCLKSFGFPPKLLLRRQRFLRSLAHFTVDPSLKWIGAIDAAYHDQAQFIRDFREFMGMTPSEYGQRDKPIVARIIGERARHAQAIMQASGGRPRFPGTSPDG